jgi:release factor glutamine methyltransferase
MTRRDALREGVGILAGHGQAGSGTPSLDASLLLAFVLGIEKDKLLASGPEPLGEGDHGRFLALIGERAKGRPVAHLVGRKEFWGRDFFVNASVLVPRPDTELLVETALRLGDALRNDAVSGEAGGKSIRVHEACTGSGCVALSLALDRPEWSVSASDISEAALEVAARNADKLIAPDLRPCFRLFAADLFDLPEGIPRGAGAGYDLLLANPPYVPSEEASRLAVSWGEPRLALDGGSDGLDLYRRLAPEAAGLLAPGGFLLAEASPEEAAELRRILSGEGFIAVETIADLAGLERVTVGRKPWTVQ